MIEYEHDLNMLQAALDIHEPWYITFREFDKEDEKLHIYLNFRRGATFACSSCGNTGNKVHDIVDEDRTSCIPENL